MPTMIVCPDPTCRAPARIVDRWTWESTSGPVEHVQTRCERGHWFTPTVDLLDPRPAPTAAEPSPIPVLADYHGATTWSDASSTFVQVDELPPAPGDAAAVGLRDGWPASNALLALTVSAATHAVIDRRWPVLLG